jgi:hypothetical protein
MSRRRFIRRTRTSVLTFVFVSVLAYLVIPWLWTWSLASNAQEEALQEALRDTERVGAEEALKDELLTKWEQEEEEFSSSLRSDIVRKFEGDAGVWAISVLVGLVAGALTWLPTTPKHLARHHRHGHRHRSHSRHRSMIH